MKYVSINNLKEGDIIAKGFEPFIKANTPLTNAKIDWLKKQGKRGIYIKSDFEDICNPIEETVPEQLQQEAVRAIYGRDIDSVIKSATKIVECICNDKNPSFDIWEMIDSDTSFHTLHVCEFAVSIAKKANYSNEKLVDVAVAALLHDIGKQLDKDDMVKIIFENKVLISSMNPKYDKTANNLHTVFGYAYLKDSPYVSALAKNAILYHHENYNGTGYFGKKGSEIKEIPSLIHLCDDYENKLRIYADPIVARDHIRAGVTNGIYNKNMAIAFLDTIPVYPIGTVVKLSNGLVATIYMQNDNLERPMVQLETGEIIDLSNVLDITISSLYNYGEDRKEKKL